MENKKLETYDDLYLTILKIGRNRIEGGLSYIDLCKELKKSNFILSGKSCLALIEYENSIRNIHYAKIAMLMAFVSIFITTISLIINYFGK